jgi:hypothetical protein
MYCDSRRRLWGSLARDITTVVVRLVDDMIVAIRSKYQTACLSY